MNATPPDRSPSDHSSDPDPDAFDAPGLVVGQALVPLLRAVRERAWIVALIVLLCVGGATLWILHRGDEYLAKTEVLVSPVPSDSTSFEGLPIVSANDGDPARSIDTAASLVLGPDTAALAAKRLQLPRATVTGAADVTADETSNIIDVEATSTQSGAEAARIANAYARAALERRQQVLRPLVAEALARAQRQLKAVLPQGGSAVDEIRARISDLSGIRDGVDPTLSISELAANGAPTGARPVVILFAALLSGIALGSVAAALAELLTPRALRREADVTLGFALPILTRVPVLRRSRDPNALGAVLPSVREAYRRLRVQLALREGGINQQQEGGGSKLVPHGLIVVVSPSPGDGRSVTALNLARAIATVGGRPAIVDFDLRSPTIAEILGIETSEDLSWCLDGGTGLREIVNESAIESVGIIAAPVEASDGMIDAIGGRMPQLVRGLDSDFDCVIVDTPPLGHFADAIPLMLEADHVVVVARLGNTGSADFARAGGVLELVDPGRAGYAMLEPQAGRSGRSRRRRARRSHPPRRRRATPNTALRSTVDTPT